jgi:hypothetical protein
VAARRRAHAIWTAYGRRFGVRWGNAPTPPAGVQLTVGRFLTDSWSERWTPLRRRLGGVGAVCRHIPPVGAPTPRHAPPARRRPIVTGGGVEFRVGIRCPPWSYSAAVALRRAILLMVARLQPVAFWMALHDAPPLSIALIPALRSAFSGRPRYFPLALALAMPWAWRRRRSS